MDLRRQHRIIYQTKIRMRAPGRDDSVVARVQNLSARGMFVTATDLPEAGTEVQCRLTLGGERRTLRGRVAWVRPASPSTPLKSPGAGIEFIELDQRDFELLTRLVEPTEERREPVDVWFEGMPTAIRCMAVVAGDGLRLETKLPFMRLQSEVRVAFPQHTPTETREGIVEGVTLEPHPEDGVPFLRVAVTVPPLDSARGVIQSAGPGTLPNDPGEKTPLASTLVDPAVAHPGPARAGNIPVIAPPDRTPTHRVSLSDVTPSVSTPPPAATLGAFAPAPPSGRRVTPAVLGALFGAALAGVVAWLSWPRFPPAGPVAAFSAGALPPGPSPEREPRAARVPPPAVPAEPAAPPVAAPEAVAEAAASAASDGPQIEPLAAAGEGGEPEGARGVTLESADGRTIVNVALAGSSAGSQEVRYADPPGIGVVLPKGRPRGGFGNLLLSRGEAGSLKVVARKRGAGSLVRVLYDGKTFQGRLGVDGDNLRVVLSRR